ncbi:MAG TPA: GNAT family N-acetyltransferase [Trebonia sp.]|nr:GNAT family N-acetyltransferase [Trebonia sp.]
MRFDPDDADAVRGCHETWEAARAADQPLDWPMSPRVLRCWLTRGWTAEPCETWFVPGAAGVDGWYRLELPVRDNTERARLHIVVRPAARRHGLGTQLLRHAARRAAANGRVTLSGDVRADCPGVPFAQQAGAAPGLVEARRVLDVRAVPDGQTARLRATAAAAAGGYSIVSWEGVTPDEHLAQSAEVSNAINDAPRGDGVEAEAWDAARVREAEMFPLAGLRAYTLAALHDASGAIAAMSQLTVDPETPELGHQGFTGVSRPHRGHRLGLLLKAAMLDWLATAEPRVERIDTWNAAANQHMIAINEALGYEVRGSGAIAHELPVAKVVD